jgi:hypothetical protein
MRQVKKILTLANKVKVLLWDPHCLILTDLIDELRWLQCIWTMFKEIVQKDSVSYSVLHTGYMKSSFQDGTSYGWQYSFCYSDSHRHYPEENIHWHSLPSSYHLEGKQLLIKEPSNNTFQMQTLTEEVFKCLELLCYLSSSTECYESYSDEHKQLFRSCFK